MKEKVYNIKNQYEDFHEIFLIFDFQLGIQYSKALKKSQRNNENKNILKI